MCTDSALNLSQLLLKMSVFDPQRQRGGNECRFIEKPHDGGAGDSSCVGGQAAVLLLQSSEDV